MRILWPLDKATLTLKSTESQHPVEPKLREDQTNLVLICNNYANRSYDIERIMRDVHLRTTGSAVLVRA
jgi:hypothetical protein